jgi:hypothetical protein
MDSEVLKWFSEAPRPKGGASLKPIACASASLRAAIHPHASMELSGSFSKIEWPKFSLPPNKRLTIPLDANPFRRLRFDPVLNLSSDRKWKHSTLQ